MSQFSRSQKASIPGRHIRCHLHVGIRVPQSVPSRQNHWRKTGFRPTEENLASTLNMRFEGSPCCELQSTVFALRKTVYHVVSEMLKLCSVHSEAMNHSAVSSKPGGLSCDKIAQAARVASFKFWHLCRYCPRTLQGFRGLYKIQAVKDCLQTLPRNLMQNVIGCQLFTALSYRLPQ